MVGGMTPLSETSETSWALGVDYGYNFNEQWGAGIGADFTIGDHKRAALFAGGISYSLLGGLKLGAAYEFHVGSLSIGPIVFLDFVGETKTNLTFGLTVGTGF